MKNTRRILSAVLTLVMVLGCMAGFTFTSAAAEEEVNLAKTCAESMIMITRGDKADGIDEFTNGVIDGADAGYWTLGGGYGYWCDDEGNTLPLEENPAVVEVKLQASYEITAIKVGFLTPGECYDGDRYFHWEAYASNDNTLAISEWTKIAEKKTNEIADGSGYKVTLATPESYQYIRVYGVYNSAIEQDDAWRGNLIQLNEVEIWGIDPEAGNEPEVLLPTPWVAPENGTNIIAGNTSCVVKVDRGNLPEMTDGICGDKPSDNYWTAGSSFDPPIENPIENESTIWFQVNLDEISEIDIIRVVALVNPEAIYHWEIYATDDPDMALEGWDFIGEKKTDEIANEDGYAIYLEEPIEAKCVRVYGTYCNLKGSDNRFRMTEIELWDVEGEVTPPEPDPEPTTIGISPFDPDNLKGFENWPAEGTQTQLLICTTENVNEAYTWKLTITDGETTKVISAKCSSAYDTWLRRFEVCTFEGENQFVPEVGVEYTISAEIYDEAGELVMIAGPAGGFVCGQEPIVPEVDPTPDPDPKPDPEPGDGGDQTGDAAVYATIAIAIAAVALAVVYKKRSTI